MPLGKFYYGCYIQDQNGDSRPFGKGKLQPISLAAIEGKTFEREYTVATTTTQEVFNVTNDLGSFDYLEVVSDISGVYVELTTDQNGSVGDEFYTIELVAKLPLILFGDGSYANYTSNFGGGTLDAIERVRVRNVSGSTTAKVYVGAVT